MSLLRIAARIADRPVSAPMDQRVHVGHFDLMAMAIRLSGVAVPLGKYDKTFVKPTKPKGPPVNSPYKSDDEARKELQKFQPPPIPKRPSARSDSDSEPSTKKSDKDTPMADRLMNSPKKKPERSESIRNRMDPEYSDTDTFANFM